MTEAHEKILRIIEDMHPKMAVNPAALPYICRVKFTDGTFGYMSSFPKHIPIFLGKKAIAHERGRE